MEGFDNNNMPVNSGDPGMQNGSDIQNTAGMPENAGFPDASSAMPQNTQLFILFALSVNTNIQ